MSGTLDADEEGTPMTSEMVNARMLASRLMEMPEGGPVDDIATASIQRLIVTRKKHGMTYGNMLVPAQSVATNNDTKLWERLLPRPKVALVYSQPPARR